MNVTTRPGDRSTVVLEVEIPSDELQRAIDEAVRHQARRTRVPGFRPGKAPRPMLERALGIRRADPAAPDPVYDDAREHLYERSVIGAIRDGDIDVLEIPAQPEWLTFVEGTGASYRVSLPVRPEVRLGDYTDYPFKPAVDPVGEDRVDAVIEQLRDQQGSLVPVEDRPARDGDYAIISFDGRRDGQPVEGARAERFPLVIGGERMIPGFEANLVGLSEGEERTFSVTFPEDYGEAELAGQEIEFSARLLELRERRLPELDDDLAAAVGPYDDLAALRLDVRRRLEVNALDRARHGFADRIIEYATANATLEPPDLLVDREVEAMVDEMKVRLAQQGIGLEEYLKVTEKDPASLRAELRDQASHRVKVLLVLGAIADREEVEVPEAAVEAELERARRGGPEDAQLVRFLETDRGRAYIRSQLRRSQTVETLIDRWIEAHPAFASVQHAEGRSPATADEIALATEAAASNEQDALLAAELATAAGEPAAVGEQGGHR